MSPPQETQSNGLLVQIASYNTNLQGVLGLPQDLVDWLSPTLQVSKFLSKARAPDIVAVGFQELLPLHLGLAGLSKAVLENRSALILSQIEQHTPNKESYSLVAKIANVGIALLVYARDDGVARKITDINTQWTGCGPAFMGNKGAVGIRFRVADESGPGETYTFVNCHLTPHDHKLKQRLDDYQHIVSTLLFPSRVPGSDIPSTLYDTSHLFVFGDMNFRLDIPTTHGLYDVRKLPQFSDAIASEQTRLELKEFDQLTVEKRKGAVFVGLREGEFWKFKCSYKVQIGEVEKYSSKRTPAWTDRVLYATYTDSPDEPEQSGVKNLLYTSIPSYTTSDHKPIVSLLLLPPAPSAPAAEIPTIRLPATYKPTPDPKTAIKKYIGRTLDRIVGFIWWILTFLGAGSGVLGLFNFFVGLGALSWWRGKSPQGTNNV